MKKTWFAFFILGLCVLSIAFLYGCGNAAGGGGGGGGGGTATYTITTTITTEVPTTEIVGTVQTTSEDTSYTSGTIVELMALASNPAYMFSSWEGDTTGETTPKTITMDGNKNITARFKIKPSGKYILNVTISPSSSSGTVELSAGGPYSAGTVIVMTTEAKGANTFDRWGGALNGSKLTTLLTMNNTKDVTAVFKGFQVDIDITRGTAKFPNKYSGWNIALSNNCYIAYPKGWNLGGSALMNWVAIPPKPGWTVGGATSTNFVPIPPGWSMGGAALTNYTPIPPGWGQGGTAGTDYFALPPSGWSVGGGSGGNYVPYASGWSVGGNATTNYISLPPTWTEGGSPTTNYVALAPGWSFGGAAMTNYVALPPGWSMGGAAGTDYVALPPGWYAAGDSSDYIPCPTNSVATLEFAFADPCFLGMFKRIQDDGTMTDDDLADMIVSSYWGMDLWWWHWWPLYF